MTTTTARLMAGAFLITTSLGPAFAADLVRPATPYVTPAVPVILPAVSGVNGKVELGGGYEWGDRRFLDHAFGTVGGSLSLPIGQQFGAQIDATVLHARGEAAGTVGGHLFWRNPATALVGVYADGFTTKVPRGDLTFGRVAGEAELYLDRVRLSALAGVEYGDRIRTRAFVDAVASFYIQDDLRLYAGFRHSFAGNQGRGGVEYQLPASTGWGNVALFAEGRVGENEYAAAMAGVRVYFGQQKSLMRRHREDDPEVWTSQHFSDAGQAIAGGKFVEKKCKPKPIVRGPGPIVDSCGNTIAPPP